MSRFSRFLDKLDPDLSARQAAIVATGLVVVGLVVIGVVHSTAPPHRAQGVGRLYAKVSPVDPDLLPVRVKVRRDHTVRITGMSPF